MQLVGSNIVLQVQSFVCSFVLKLKLVLSLEERTQTEGGREDKVVGGICGRRKK